MYEENSVSQLMHFTKNLKKNQFPFIDLVTFSCFWQESTDNFIFRTHLKGTFRSNIRIVRLLSVFHREAKHFIKRKACIKLQAEPKDWDLT